MNSTGKEPEGILLVDKPKGLTSHDAVARLRRVLGMKRIGHAGTLDPMATGLLILLIGKATKASQYLIGLDKEYDGTIKLGETTDSQDAEGQVMVTAPVPPLAEEDVRRRMEGFLGDQYQTPPMHSAIKVEGVPLYKMARKGKEVKREPRFIRIHSFVLRSFHSPLIDFTLTCTKGTYVRTIAHDLGQRIGCGAHLCALRRTASESFKVDQALPLGELESLGPREIEKRLIPLIEALPRALS